MSARQLAKRHKPGSKWRTLAWNRWTDEKVEDGDDRHPGAIFDELVVDHWFHLEQMDNRLYWMAVYRADGTRLVINVAVGERGLARLVEVEEDG